MFRHHWNSLKNHDRFRHIESIDDEIDEITQRDKNHRPRKWMIIQHNRLLQDRTHPNRICYHCDSHIPHRDHQYHQTNWNEIISTQKQISFTTSESSTCISCL